MMEREGARLPRYRELAEVLSGQITAGTVKIGDRLPGEIDIGRMHGVSRHTVREALRLLEERGLVGRRPGVGTVVKSSRAEQAFVQRIVTVSELFSYPADTQLRVLGSTEVRADSTLARLIDCPPGELRVQISGIRARRDNGLAVCLTDVYVLPHCAGVIDLIGDDTRPVYKLVEDLCGERAEDVTVHLEAVTLTEEQARPLDVMAGTAALRIVRQYRNAGGRVYETSVSWHPAERFTYTLHLSGTSLEPAPVDD